LHIALLALGLKPGDEVITTPMSFIATSNAVIHAGGIPRFADVEPDTGLIDPDLIESAITPRTRGIIPVHLYGQMADMKAIRDIADRHGLFVLEDSAHAIEAERDGIKPGQKGDMAAFSFYATKVITCGEGGAITAHTPEHDDLLRKLRLHGMSAGAADRYSGLYRHWDMDLLGWKYNMTNFQAAMLIPQLPKMEDWCARREEICLRYEQVFSAAGIGFPKVVPGSKSSRHLFTIWVAERDRVLAELGKRGVGVAVNYRAIHLRKYYVERFGYKPGTFPIAERIGDMTISLPLYPGLRDEEVDYVIDCVKEVVG
ncbi:MAG: DegT/DnrJ/EryC1/StrS family aminotransferase, partial [Candidatus Hydrothermia bacterium]